MERDSTRCDTSAGGAHSAPRPPGWWRTPDGRRRSIARRPSLAVLVVLAGCATSILGTDPDTGVDVAVRKGPIFPVVQPGQDDTAPVEDARVRIRPLGADGHAEARTDAGGMAGFALVAGTYEVAVLECPGTLALPAPDTAIVTAGERTVLTLVCDTGIR